MNNCLVFSVFDTVAKAYLRPFFGPTTEFAIRAFRELCEEPGHQFNRFPEDYVLYELGTFDEMKGQLAGHAGFAIARAIEFSKSSTPLHLVHENVSEEVQ